MLMRLRCVGLTMLLAATLDCVAWSEGPHTVRPPDDPLIISAGRTVGERSRDFFLDAGDFFKKLGVTAGRESARLFTEQGKFWKRFGQSFADFQVQPAGRPQKVDHW